MKNEHWPAHVNCFLIFFAIDGPILDILDIVASGVDFNVLISTNPALYNALARILPTPSNLISGSNSCLTPYFVLIRRLDKVSRISYLLNNLANSYNAYNSQSDDSTILCISPGSTPSLSLRFLSLLSLIHSYRAKKLLEQLYSFRSNNKSSSIYLLTK